MSKITIDSLTELKNVSQPVIHENTVFYLETEINETENRYETSVHSIDTGTKERKVWAAGGTTNTQLQVSPNGKWVSYLSNDTEEEKMQVMLMPLNGGGAVQLTDEKEGVSSYEWAHSGASIYYQTNQKKENGEKKEKELPKPTVITRLQYKLDGVGVIPEDRIHQIKKVEVATKHTQVVMENDRSIGLSYISKDESFLLLSDKLDIEDEWQYGGTVYWYDVASKETRSLTESIPEGVFQFGAMNESEDYALLLGNDFEYAFVSQTKVYGYDLSNQTLTCLTEEADLEVSDVLVADFQQQVNGLDVTWMDNETFLFPVSQHGKVQLYKGDTSGKLEKVYDELIHLTDGSLSEDGKTIAVSVSTPVKPSELRLLDLETGKETVLYNPNASFEEAHTFVDPERFWYKGADDWDIQGWYMRL